MLSEDNKKLGCNGLKLFIAEVPKLCKKMKTKMAK